MDPLEQVIREIHAELDRRCARVISPYIGKLEKDKHKRPPVIIWEEQGGADEEPNATMADTLLFDVSRVRVTVWAPDEEYARLLLWNLKQAGRAVWGRDIQWVDRSPPNDAKETGYLTCGIVIVANARIYLRIRKRSYQLPDGQEVSAGTKPRQVTGETFTAALDPDGEI